MYRLDKIIGKGGYAVAYKAYCLKTKTNCVIKKMDFEGFTQYEQDSCLGEANRLKLLSN
jgi:serine/threonine protein kinase